MILVLEEVSKLLSGWNELTDLTLVTKMDSDDWPTDTRERTEGRADDEDGYLIN